MSKLIYVKYNSFRRPDYRISTEIVEDGGKLAVVKKPMNHESEENLARIADKYDMLKDLYAEIEPIPCEKKENTVVFPYIKGSELLSDVDLQHLDEAGLYSEIDKALDKVFAFKQSPSRFVRTDRFAEVFGDLHPDENEESYPVTNIDSNFDNFLFDGDKIYCIDYEWVADFPVPIRFIKYRTLLYFFTKNGELLKEGMTIGGFLEHYGFSSEDIKLFGAMDDNFQQFVHGENRKYILTSRYEKGHKSLDELVDLADRLPKEIKLKEQHISNLDTVVKNKDTIIKDRDTHISNLDQIIKCKDVHISNLDQTIKDKDVHIDDLNQAVTERDILVGNLDRAVKDRDYAIAHLNSHIADYKHAMRNPFFAMKLAARKIKSKFSKPEPVTEPEQVLEPIEEPEPLTYEEWIEQVEAGETYDETFEYNPKISVVVPVYNVLDKHLVPCIESVLGQIYQNVELCIADDNSTWDNVRATLKKYEDDPRVKIIYRSGNGHISRSTNSALELATGEFIALLDCDDTLSPNALYEVVKELNKNRELDFIYSDEDKIDDDGNNRHMPHFKPDWSPDTMMSHMYTCHLGVYRTDIVRKIGGLRPGYEGSQDYDLVLRFTEQTTNDKIAHIAKVLYHWRERAESTSVTPEAKPYILEAARKAKEDALVRRGLKGELELVPNIYQWRVNYISTQNPLVSIIIPSKDNYELLKQCLDTLTGKTEYKNYEIVVVDNGSSEENKTRYQELIGSVNGIYVYNEEEFNFSHMCNVGASKAAGEYLLFLNDDIEIMDGEWLGRMLGQAELPHTGAVGAKLLYPGGDIIQHCGVMCIGTGPVHAFGGMSDSIIYYFGRNKIDYNWSAVTAACLMVKADKFKEINGFNEDLRVAYNDVDLCLRLCEAGYYNIVRNDVILYHHESASRGDDRLDEAKMQRLTDERNRLYSMHPGFDFNDPFYNPNLSYYSNSFENNYYSIMLPQCIVTETKDTGKESDELNACIDCLYDNKCVFIQGWGFIPGKCGEGETVLILDSGDNTYTVTTVPHIRPDLRNVFPNERYIEKSGFRMYFSKETMKPGKYTVSVSRCGLKKTLDNHIIVGRGIE